MIFRLIYWLEGPEEGGQEKRADVHILSSEMLYTKPTLDDFNRLATELQETFPQADQSQLFVGRVRKTTPVQGISGEFNIVVWKTTIPCGDYYNWKQVRGEPEYEYVP